MTTAGDLVTSISHELHGYTSVKDRLTSLSAALTATATTFTVSDTSGQLGLTPGIVEIDSEQLYVSSLDTGTSTATVASFGRGFNGTTAVAHDSGALVVSNPTWPRADILTMLNRVLLGTWPQLFAVKTDDTNTITSPSDTYTLTDLQSVLDVQWKDPLNNWQRCEAWSVDPYDNTVRLVSGGIIGRPIRFVYSAKPTAFTDETTTYSDCGLPDSCQDLLILGTVARLVPALDIARAQINSVEQSDRSKVVPSGQALNVAKLLTAEFVNQLNIEARSLRKQYPPRIHSGYNR